MSNIAKLKKKAADFEQKKQFEKALQLYIQALEEAGKELDDADVPLYNRVGDLLMRQGDVSDALAYYERAVDVYSERGFLNNAIALCNKILRQSPARTAVYYKLGKISATKGFKSDAKKNFLEYADRMQKAGHRDEAFRALKEFADLCPDQDDVRLMLAELLTKDNRKYEAIEQLQVLHEKLESEGRGAEARATLDRMKAIDPEAAPRSTGVHNAIRPNELVFLDLGGAAAAAEYARGGMAGINPVAAGDALDAAPPESALAAPVPALDGLLLTFVPGEESEGLDLEDHVSPLPDRIPSLEELLPDVPLVSGYSTEGINRTGKFTAVEADVESLLEGPPARPEDLSPDAVDALLDPTALHQDWGVPLFDAAHSDGAGDVSPLSEVLPLSGSEFAEMALLETVPRRDTPAHDFSLPTDLPLLQDDTATSANSDCLPADAPVDEHPIELRSDMPQLDASSGERSTADEAAPDESTVDDDTATYVASDELGEVAPAPGDPEFADAHASAPQMQAPADADEATIEEVFRESFVALPLLDVASPPFVPTADADVVLTNLAPMFMEGSAEGLVSEAPGFGETAEGEEFQPAPHLSQETLQPDSWPADATPEVLIDGEWHDERVGDVLGVLDASRQGAVHSAPERFDDLAAAMMWPPPEASDDATDTGELSPTTMHTPRGHVSFGGVEEQLSRRLEIDPENHALRRQLGEALLDSGRREEGLHQLDLAMTGFELAGRLDEAQSVADGIILLLPASVRHHQKRVEYAVRANDRARLVEAYLELGDALFRTGDPGKSMVVYSRVLELNPGNERAAFALSALMPTTSEALDAAFEDRSILPYSERHGLDSGARADQDIAGDPPVVVDAHTEPSTSLKEETGSADTAQEPARFVGAADEQEVDAAFDYVDAVVGRFGGSGEEGPVTEPRGASGSPESVAPRVIPPEVAQVPADSKPTPATTVPDNDFVDLGAWLRDTEPARSTRMTVDDARPTGDEQADFQEMLRRFKRGVAENVDEEDYESHYDLGVAYKEMGLVDEAISQFQRSLRGAAQRVKSYEALGQCFVEKGQYQVAAALLQRAVESAATDDHQLVGVLFLLGFAMEAMGRQTEAVRYYQRVFAVDIEFRDVVQRLATLEPVTL